MPPVAPAVVRTVIDPALLEQYGLTLHDLAAEYGVSAERIRQIEAAAMKKMKKTLAEYA